MINLKSEVDNARRVKDFYIDQLDISGQMLSSIEAGAVQ